MKVRRRLLPARLRGLSSSSLLGPVLTLLSGTVAAQALSYLARPVLTRLFPPEAFGLFAFYVAAVAVLAMVATGKYEDAIPLPSDDRQAARVARLAATLCAGFSLLAMGVVPFREPLAAAFGQAELAPFIALIPLGVLATGWGITAELWLTRTQRYRPISGSRVAQGLATAPTQIAAGASGIGAVGLVGGHLIGRVVATALLAVSVLGRSDSRFRGSSEPGGVRAVARRYQRFPLFAMPSGFLSVFSKHLPAFLLLALFAPEVAGYYALAFGTLAVPVQLVGSAVGQVFFARAAEARHSGGLPELTRDVARRLSAVGVFPLAALGIAGPAAIAFVFGAEWREAGVYAQWLAPWLFLILASAPLTTLFDVLERQSAELAYNVALTLARAGALMAGAALGDARTAVALFAGVSAAFSLGQALWVFRMGGVRLTDVARWTARHVALAAVPLALVAAVVWSELGDGWTVLALVGAGLLAAALLLRYEPDLLPAGAGSPS